MLGTRDTKEHTSPHELPQGTHTRAGLTRPINTYVQTRVGMKGSVGTKREMPILLFSGPGVDASSAGELSLIVPSCAPAPPLGPFGQVHSWLPIKQ